MDVAVALRRRAECQMQNVRWANGNMIRNINRDKQLPRKDPVNVWTIKLKPFAKGFSEEKLKALLTILDVPSHAVEIKNAWVNYTPSIDDLDYFYFEGADEEDVWVQSIHIGGNALHDTHVSSPLDELTDEQRRLIEIIVSNKHKQ